MTVFQIPSETGRSLVDHDPRNRAHPARGVLFPASAGLPVVDKVHRRGGAYDQTPFPHCVSHAGKGLLNTAPLSREVRYDVRSEYDTVEWYNGAQLNDEWAGENYAGTSARGLLRYLASIGKVQTYVWSFGLQEVLNTLVVRPLMIGTWWTEQMSRPNANGTISSLGNLTSGGGHEWEAFGVLPSKRLVVCMNSWGSVWGDRGRFYLTYDQLDELLSAHGDAVTVIR